MDKQLQTFCLSFVIPVDNGKIENVYSFHPVDIKLMCLLEQIFSRGSIVDFGSKSTYGTYNTLPLQLTQAMAPRSTVVVYFVRSDGEVVADSITVNIEGVFKNKVIEKNYHRMHLFTVTLDYMHTFIILHLQYMNLSTLSLTGKKLLLFSI